MKNKITCHSVVLFILLILLPGLAMHAAEPASKELMEQANPGSIPNDLKWGPENSGTSIAIAIGHINDPANLKSIPVNIFIKNTGKTPISSPISAYDGPDYWMFYTRDEHGMEIAVNPMLQTPKVGSGMVLVVFPGETRIFPISLPLELVPNIQHGLFAAMNFMKVGTNVTIHPYSATLEKSAFTNFLPKPPSTPPPPSKTSAN